MVGKKVGFFFIYYFLGSLIDQIAFLFFGDNLLSLSVTVVALAVISRALRINYIIEKNYGQETRDEYNASFSNKLKRIVNAKEFKTEAIIGAVMCLLFTLIPFLAKGFSYGLAYLFDLSFIVGIMNFVVFILVDIAIWLLAYGKCFKVKKF